MLSDSASNLNDGDLEATREVRHLFPLFTSLSTSAKCCRCKDIVYQYERVGPVHDVVFHKKCFRCFVCGQYLNLKNCWSSQCDAEDQEIYCISHYPRVGTAHVTQDSVGIKQAIAAQNKIRRHFRPTIQVRLPENTEAPHLDNESVQIKHDISASKYKFKDGHREADAYKANIDGNALHIKRAVEAQKLQKRYQKNLDRHHYPPHIVRKREALFDAQKKLEDQMRKEEDELLMSFQKERKAENQRLSQEIEEEWEKQLVELTKKFNDKSRKKMADIDKKAMTLQFESQKKDLEKSMTMKRERKKKSMTLRLREIEQQKTSTMVQRQSAQMLKLVSEMRDELRVELKKELIQEKQMEDEEDSYSDIANTNGTDGVLNEMDNIRIEEVIQHFASVPTSAEMPPTHPPSSRKHDLYTDVSVFNDIDEHVIKVAETDQGSYTELIRQLTESCIGDLEKARSIYRWITVMDLNVMNFKEIVDEDTPHGLLRGIKLGTETYHVLFMRLCSYAGLQCVEIKGHSKSVGYEPGMKINPESFQNTWNAVYIDGDWRLVQCNWGARHLVLNKDKSHEKVNKRDQIRYQYDEHYFLTDPDEFIQEFWPHNSEWQLIEKPITLEEFEAMPFVRSVFFHYEMTFEGVFKSVLETNAKGGVDIKIRVPEKLENSLLFFYQLRSADKDRRHETTYKGDSLERFVFQTMFDNVAIFNIHVPTQENYYFEIFANKIDELTKLTNEANTPIRLKCASKFKIICKQMSGKMQPLPNCASGEWGPKKALRHFGIEQIYPDNMDSHTAEYLKGGLLDVYDRTEIHLNVPRPLTFVAKLRMNNVEDSILEPYLTTVNDHDKISIFVTLPKAGQYGIDLYARAKDSPETAPISHVCKYLLNCSGVKVQRNLPHIATPVSQDKKENMWGPTQHFHDFKLQTVSHHEPKISARGLNPLTIKMSAAENLDFSCHMVREPKIECENSVLIHRDSEPGCVKFVVQMPEYGNYMLCIYAKEHESQENTYFNVYNYMVKYFSKEFVPSGNFSASFPSLTKLDKSLRKKMSVRKTEK